MHTRSRSRSNAGVAAASSSPSELPFSPVIHCESSYFESNPNVWRRIRSEVVELLRKTSRPISPINIERTEVFATHIIFILTSNSLRRRDLIEKELPDRIEPGDRTGLVVESHHLADEKLNRLSYAQTLVIRVCFKPIATPRHVVLWTLLLVSLLFLCAYTFHHLATLTTTPLDTADIDYSAPPRYPQLYGSEDEDEDRMLRYFRVRNPNE